jgi:hypothetical protein
MEMQQKSKKAFGIPLTGVRVQTKRMMWAFLEGFRQRVPYSHPLDSADLVFESQPKWKQKEYGKQSLSV